MRIEDVQRVLILGAGTMGKQIGLQCAMHGYKVAIYDIDPGVLDHAMAEIRTVAVQLVEKKYLTPDAADEAVDAIILTYNPEEGAADADLLIEAVTEDQEVKAKVFAQFNKLCPSRTIFVTNTSSMLPSMFAETSGRPTQFAALHFHLLGNVPAGSLVNSLIDIMPHKRTSKETILLLQDFAKRIKQIPNVLNKENPGYVFNSMLFSCCGAAIALVANGISTVENVDRAWMVVMGTPSGPFGLMDMIGLNTCWQVTNHLAKEYPDDPQVRKNAEFLTGYVDKGWLGVKSGQGFYTYPDPAFSQSGFLSGE